jgi:hypothetical protein
MPSLLRKKRHGLSNSFLIFQNINSVGFGTLLAIRHTAPASRLPGIKGPIPSAALDKDFIYTIIL